MEKIKCIQDYEDVMLKRIVTKDDELEVTKERAEYLVDIRKLCVRMNEDTTEEDTTEEDITEEDTTEEDTTDKNTTDKDTSNETDKIENKNNKKGTKKGAKKE